jgi:hypothetical protein
VAQLLSLGGNNNITEKKGYTMKILNLLALAVCSFLLAGCATAPMTSTSLDAEAKQFTPDPGMANIYLIRNFNLIAKNNEYKTTLDGRFAGVLAPGTYQLLSVPPGEHVLSWGGQHKVTVEAGKNYFFDVEASMPLALLVGDISKLESLPEEQGRKEVLNLKRAEATSYYE